MEILNKVGRLSAQEMLEKIEKAALINYGLHRYPVKEYFSGNPGKRIVASLDNADTDHVLLEILRENPDKIFEGIEIAAELSGTSDKVLHIPDEETELMDSLKILAQKYDVALISGIVDVRIEQECIYLHIVSAKELADVFYDCYIPGIYVSVNGNKLCKVAKNAKIASLFESEGITDIKGILGGYVWHDPAFAEKTVGEADLSNGVLCTATSKDCIVQITQRKLLASRKTSCGKCVFCREGLIQLEYMQREIMEGKGKNEFLELTDEIGAAMCFSTSCSVGQTSAKIVLSATEQFEEEYEAHIRKKICPAGACTAFVNIYIDPSVCNGCGECMDICPKDCIEGKNGYIHMIDTFDCTKCGKCISACEEEAIIRTTGKVPKLPNRLTKVGRFRKH